MRFGLLRSRKILGGMALAGALTGAIAFPAAASAASREFATVGTNVNVRSCATTSCSVVATLGPSGSPWIVQCYKTGTSVSGDNVWYYGSYGGLSGYIAGYWLSTGTDPYSGATHC